ncbi:MAG: serine protease, partial [Candidatus Electrothrix sp. ATG2]|nr:serine protease [Candidatus Electrothrix sp. ATG2]
MNVIKKRLEQSRAALLDAVPKVGRIEIEGISPYLGTGWMIEEDIMITNRHVANLFATRMGGSFAFKYHTSGRVRVDFREEHDRSHRWRAKIKQIVFLEEAGNIRPDMALLRLEPDGNPIPEPIGLDDVNPSRNSDPNSQLDIAVIGYPARDPRSGDLFEMDDIFRRIYEKKRLSPGKITGVDADGRRLYHDGTTLGGSSGSPVINLTTGKVCGLHYGGRYKLENYTVSVGWLKSRLAEITPRLSVALSPATTLTPESSTTPASPSTSATETPSTPAEPSIISSYAKGYDSNFLGNEMSVPLPDVSDPDLIAPVLDTDDGVLRYTHFSIVMHKERRLPSFT